MRAHLQCRYKARRDTCWLCWVDDGEFDEAKAPMKTRKVPGLILSSKEGESGGGVVDRIEFGRYSAVTCNLSLTIFRLTFSTAQECHRCITPDSSNDCFWSSLKKVPCKENYSPSGLF